ncbi:MAG: DUF3500 domain-containing protein [Planctomycetes bacterium]|nr:DUF3500 domain-containing protein [Planctomycetota bacterium]
MKTVLICTLSAAFAAGALVPFRRSDGEPAAVRMQREVEALLASFDEAQRAKATFPFADAERRQWHFVPNVYPGVQLNELSVAQKCLVHRLLISVLSASGYHKTTTIVRLEDTLRDIAEAAGRKDPRRDPGRYSIAVFGEPSGDGGWGVRLQGHHVSWNFTTVDRETVLATPAFLGANPAEVRTGMHAGLRALPEEEDLGFELLGTLSETQKKTARLADTAPPDVVWGPGKTRESLGAPRGLAWTAMDERQRELLWRLIRVYLQNLEDWETAATKLLDAGRNEIHFAWMGATERGAGHYYRIQGPTFAIEYDNTQNGANHVHTVWHDLTNDFGVDALRAHYEQHHRSEAGK